MSELFNHTPTWVFIVFFTLLIFGVNQTKERVVKINTVFILPIAMIVFSFMGVYSAFSLALLPFTFWLLGLVSASFIGLQLGFPKLVNFSSQDNQVTIPGSKIPLVFMMAIFFTKYFVAFAFARNLYFVNEFHFLVIISLFYGVFSGVFLSRSLVMFKVSKL